MKIVQVCPYAMNRPGGVQCHVRSLTAWLIAKGHETLILAPPAPGDWPQSDGSLIELGRSSRLSLHGTAFEISLAAPIRVRILAGELSNWGADLFHLHTPWTPCLATQIWRALKLPTVTTVHATLPAHSASGLVGRYIRHSARKFLRRSRAIVVPSGAPLAMLQALVPHQQAHTLPPAIDLAPWRKAASSERRQTALKIAFLGRLEERKGINVLLEAWPRIAAAVPSATLTIAGDGALRSQVEATRGHGIRYVGALDDAAAQTLLGESDLLLAPAPYGESYGLVLAEAMAAGAVPIAAANPGYASLLASKADDLLVMPGDASALADAAIALAKSPEKLKSLRAWATRAAEKSDIETVGPQYLALYRGLLA